MNYTLYADRQEGGRQPRVVFMGSSVSTVMGNFMLAVDGNPECVRQTGILQVCWARLALGDWRHLGTAFSMFFLVIQNANADIQTVPIVPAIDAAVLQGPKPAAGDGVDVRTDLMTDRLYSRLVGNTSTSVRVVCGCHDNCMYWCDEIMCVPL